MDAWPRGCRPRAGGVMGKQGIPLSKLDACASGLLGRGSRDCGRLTACCNIGHATFCTLHPADPSDCTVHFVHSAFSTMHALPHTLNTLHEMFSALPHHALCTPRSLYSASCAAPSAHCMRPPFFISMTTQHPCLRHPNRSNTGGPRFSWSENTDFCITPKHFGRTQFGPSFEPVCLCLFALCTGCYARCRYSQ